MHTTTTTKKNNKKKCAEKNEHGKNTVPPRFCMQNDKHGSVSFWEKHFFFVSHLISTWPLQKLINFLVTRPYWTQQLGNSLFWIDIYLYVFFSLSVFCRYIAVTQPIKYAKHKNSLRIFVTILLVWAISIAIGSPIVLGLNNTPNRVPDLCAFFNTNFIIFSSLVSFYIPTGIMVFLYWNIFKVSTIIHIQWLSFNMMSYPFASWADICPTKFFYYMWPTISNPIIRNKLSSKYGDCKCHIKFFVLLKRI